MKGSLWEGGSNSFKQAYRTPLKSRYCGFCPISSDFAGVVDCCLAPPTNHYTRSIIYHKKQIAYYVHPNTTFTKHENIILLLRSHTDESEGEG